MKNPFPISNGKREISSIFSDHQSPYKRSEKGSRSPDFLAAGEAASMGAPAAAV